MKTFLLLITICISSVSFGQTSGGGVTDIDGNIYETVIIGTQEWMTKNLNVSQFNDGTSIKEVTNMSDWINAISNKEPAYCYLEFNRTKNSRYGKIYNYYAFENYKLAPKGFHISTHQDWVVLEEYIGDDAFKKLKTKTGWKKIRTGNEGIACNNCKDWAKSYKIKNSCHVCKDTRYSGRRAPIKYFSSNGSDVYGFSVMESGLIERNKFNTRGTTFWTNDYKNLGGAGTAEFTNYNRVDENGSQIYSMLFGNMLLVGSASVPLESGCYIRCLKGNSRESKEQTFLMNFNDAINEKVKNKDFQLAYDELNKSKYNQIDKEYRDAIEDGIDKELLEYMSELFNAYRFEEFFGNLNNLSYSKGDSFVWYQLEKDFEVLCKKNIENYEMIDNIDSFLYYFKESNIYNNNKKVYDKYDGIRNEIELKKVIQTQLTDFEKKIIGEYKMKSKPFKVGNGVAKWLIKSHVTINNNREMTIIDMLVQTTSSKLLGTALDLASGYRSGSDSNLNRVVNNVIFRAYLKENNLVHFDIYYTEKNKLIKDTYELIIDSPDAVSCEYISADGINKKLTGKKVK